MVLQKRPSPNSELKPIRSESKHQLRRIEYSLRPWLTINSRNVYYVYDATGTFKLIIDIDEESTVFEKKLRNNSRRFPENAFQIIFT